VTDYWHAHYFYLDLMTSTVKLMYLDARSQHAQRKTVIVLFTIQNDPSEKNLKVRKTQEKELNCVGFF